MSVLSPPIPLAASPDITNASAISPAWVKARGYLLLLAVMSACWIAGEILASQGVIESPLSHLIHGVQYASFYFVMMFACFTLLHLGSRPPQAEWRTLCLAGPAATFGLWTLNPVTQFGFTIADAACVGFGLSSMTILGTRTLRTDGDERARALSLLLLTCMLLVFTVLNPFFQDVTNLLTPSTLDQYAYAADETLGTQWSFVLGRCFEALPPLRIASAVVYYTLLFAFFAVLVLQQRTQTPPCLDIFPTLLATTLIGYSIYLLFPLVGPAALFCDSFPWVAPAVSQVLTGPLEVPASARNCMPSLHTTWVLLIWWHCRPFAWPIRFVAGIYVTFTLLATLGFGFHYLVDLIVAVPFAVLVQAQATPATDVTARQRWHAMALGGVLVVLWLVAIRYGLGVLAWSPWLGWAAALVTIVVSWRAERRLYRAVCEAAG